LDYESKQTFAEEFYGFQAMFLLLGSVLCAIIGLVGVLNFFNAILTGILVRRRELAMLQAVGMTGRQMKTMLVWEGVCYALAAALTALTFSLVAEPLLGQMMEQVFWFFRYRFTIWPVLCIVPLFLLLGVTLPLVMERLVARHSIVERLRQTD